MTRAIMNRDDFQRLALIRIEDAKTLLDSDRCDGAYYLAGYSVECSLKACIAKRTRQYDFPDKKVVNDSYTHSLDRLVQTAVLQGELDGELKRSKEFAENWGTVSLWDEESRYRMWSKSDAENLYNAIAEPQNGVLRWLKQHW